jgi:NAD(P)H-flavin reductase
VKLPAPEKFSARVVEVVWETPTVYLFRWKRVDGKPFNFIAGQWALVRVDRPDGTDVRRAYSIASPPFQQEYIELCIKLVEGGEMTPILAQMREGAEFPCAGPYGKFILPPDIDNDVVIAATGTGIAPFRAMVEDLFYGSHKGRFHHDVHLFFGVRYENEIIYRPLWEKLQKEFDNFHFYLTLSRPQPEWKGYKGYVQPLLKEHFTKWDGEDFYSCGVSEMVDEMKAYFLNLGAPKAKVHYEKWF